MGYVGRYVWISGGYINISQSGRFLMFFYNVWGKRPENSPASESFFKKDEFQGCFRAALNLGQLFETEARGAKDIAMIARTSGPKCTVFNPKSSGNDVSTNMLILTKTWRHVKLVSNFKICPKKNKFKTTSTSTSKKTKEIYPPPPLQHVSVATLQK